MTDQSNDALYLALDQGGHATRAIVFDHAGIAVCSHEKSIATRRFDGGRVEHSADELAYSLADVMEAVLKQLGAQRSARIAGVGLSSQRSSVVCWNRDTGVPLSPVLSWQDTRAAKRMEAFASRRRQLHQITGMFPSAHYGASKLAWCLEHLDEVARAADVGQLAMGPLASFLAVQLCGPGGFVVDPANAGRTMLWDVRNRDWHIDLLREFGIDRNWLPRCTNTVGCIGSVDALPGKPPLAVISGDQPAAVFANGLPQAGDIFVNAGTGAFIQRPQSEFPAGVERLPVSVVLADPSQVLYAVEGTVNGAAGALDWFAQSESIVDWRDAAPAWLREIDAPPLFLNGVGGLGSPFWVAEFPSSFVGEGTAAARWVAVLESVVFLLRTNLDQMGQGSDGRRIIVSGGLSALDGFCQRLADLCQLPVMRPTLREATARGTACLLRPNYIWDNVESPAADAHFDPQANSALLGRYHTWRELMPALDGA